jgi:hypothetical protein
MPYIVQTASAKMPTSVKAPYRRIAVLEVEPGVERVAMISPRARGVVRVVDTWERLHARGVRSAYALALDEAKAVAAMLNATESKP